MICSSGCLWRLVRHSPMTLTWTCGLDRAPIEMRSILKVSIRQIKAARALLGWPQEDLAAMAGVSVPIVKRLEAADGCWEAARTLALSFAGRLNGLVLNSQMANSPVCICANAVADMMLRKVETQLAGAGYRRVLSTRSSCSTAATFLNVAGPRHSER